MPKRRVTPKRAAQLKKFQAAGARARRSATSYTHPDRKIARQKRAYYAALNAGEKPYAPPGVGGRRSKLGGKAYTKKSGGFKINPAIAKVLGK